jgi:glutaconate CoA-transferase, subunit B
LCLENQEIDMEKIAYPGTDRYSMAELMTILIARRAAGSEEKRGGGGAGQVIPLAAMRLARITVAPNLWMTTAGAGVYNGTFDTLPLGAWDPRSGVGGECKLYMMDVVDRQLASRSHEDYAGAGFGGIQIDKYGNVNMIGIGGPYPKLKVRGPGTIGVIWQCSYTGCAGVFTEHHNNRVLVDKVDYISGAGWMDGGDSRYKTLAGREGPQIAWTPICVCDFTEEEHLMRLVSVHPGYTVKDVVDNTGFELVMPKKVQVTTAPTDWELEMLRTRVDKGGQLRKRELTVGC